ncbi:hypothetical protein MMC14_002037 [Varicellaria rhodocarpa]|nr:hypothetical protein [Varicellaria rhodocarpa]
MTRYKMSDSSPNPLPTPLAMSAADPTPSPIPLRPASLSPNLRQVSRPHPKPGFPTPKLLLKVTHLTHPGASIFFGLCNPISVLSDAVTIVLQTLYIPFENKMALPPVRSITLILKPMDGVANTSGSDLDDEHKEIRFSLDYIASIQPKTAERQRDEIIGVLVHEMVHVWQWNGFGTAPSGLVEGVADFVRLRAALGPPHWKRAAGDDWDAGYDKTAFFFDWLEFRCGEGSVMRINESLRKNKHNEDEFWKNLFGETVKTLWAEYSKELGKESKAPDGCMKPSKTSETT